MEFKKKLSEIRQKEGLNLREISDLTGIPYISIRNYSSGARSPSWEQIQKIADTPRLQKYRAFLLSSDHTAEQFAHLDKLEVREAAPTYPINREPEPTYPVNPELLSIIRILEKQGRGEEVEEYLKALLAEQRREEGRE